MGYKYFCTYCGHENTADTVLFNMDPLLTGEAPDRDPLRILHFHLTGAQLKGLIETGEPAEDGFSRVTLTLEDLLYCLGEKISCDEKKIALLSPRELKRFVYGDEDSAAGTPASGDEDLVDFGTEEDDFFSDEESPAEEKTEAAQTEKELPEAIRAMLALSRTNTDAAIDAEILKNDLYYIASRFLNAELAYTFTIKADYQLDDTGDPVMTGYWIGRTLFEETRVCARCMKPVFSRAGTAPHKVVTFVGETASGKTSTILALTHYCRYGLHPLGSETHDALMWKKEKTGDEDFPTENVFTTLLSDDSRLKNDLEWFSFGVAPAETQAVKREDAYHSTFLVENTGENPGRTILSLMDLPGELFNYGHLDKQRMYDQFPAAFSASAFVICFDTENVTQEKITNMIDFYSQLQVLRKEFTGEKPWIPCMILFTKSDEKNVPAEADCTKLESLYMLRDEKAFLESGDAPIHETYESVKKLFADIPLANCYYAVLRTGAFGHEAVRSDEIKEAQAGFFDDVKVTDDKETKVRDYAAARGMDTEKMRPQPNSIDTLMHWILRVSGCAQAKAQYRTKTVLKKVSDYLKDTQLRSENPGSVEQAMLRASLFSDPGYWDAKMVQSLNYNEENLITKFDFLKKYVKDSTADIMVRMAEAPDTNARGDK